LPDAVRARRWGAPDQKICGSCCASLLALSWPVVIVMTISAATRREVILERGHRPGATFQTKRPEVPSQSVGQLRALADHRKKRALANADQRGLLEEPGVDAIQEELRADREIDEGDLLDGQRVMTSQVGNQLTTPGAQRLAHASSTINDTVAMYTHGPLQR
jgi:hypothetical protein